MINISLFSFHNKYCTLHLSKWKEELYHLLDKTFLNHKLTIYKMIAINGFKEIIKDLIFLSVNFPKPYPLTIG
jgi:hypothetical protein